MPSTLCPLALQTVFDAAGRPIVGALLTVYLAGTLTPAIAYSDATLNTPIAQPISTTGSGRLPPIYVGAGTFRYRLTDPNGVPLDDVDGVQGAVVTEITNNITSTVAAAPVGGLLHFYGTSVPAGWVRANGRSIGNSLSGATEYADPSTEPLFVQLWNADPNLLVAGGRGNTAEADYNAGKAIALPDLRRRVLAGLDGMGNGYAGTNAVYPYYTLGSRFGEEGHTLTLAEAPTHSHVMSCDVEGGHTHVTTCDIQGTHAHSATANQQGEHAHSATMDVQGAHTHSASSDIQGGHVHSASSSTQGNHTHTASSDIQGNHTHTASCDIQGGVTPAATMDAQGTHSHQASTDSQGDHNHQYTHTTYISDGPVNSSFSAYLRNSQVDASENTSTAGAHTHNITVLNAGSHLLNITVSPIQGHQHGITNSQNGDHQHAITLLDAGDHQHTITLLDAGEHQHTITVQDAGDHQHNITVQDAGQHSHDITVIAAGAHQHNVTTADAGEHTHGVTAGSSGGGGVHNNMQPSMPVTILIKL